MSKNTLVPVIGDLGFKLVRSYLPLIGTDAYFVFGRGYKKPLLCIPAFCADLLVDGIEMVQRGQPVQTFEAGGFVLEIARQVAGFTVEVFSASQERDRLGHLTVLNMIANRKQGPALPKERPIKFYLTLEALVSLRKAFNEAGVQADAALIETMLKQEEETDEGCEDAAPGDEFEIYSGTSGKLTAKLVIKDIPYFRYTLALSGAVFLFDTPVYMQPYILLGLTRSLEGEDFDVTHEDKPGTPGYLFKVIRKTNFVRIQGGFHGDYYDIPIAKDIAAAWIQFLEARGVKTSAARRHIASGAVHTLRSLN
jgi:hypothetical protein